jgi:dihydrofolate reductase
MRKVVLAVSSSLDGYIARPNGEVDFLSMPKDLSTPPFSAAIDTYVLGRKTYDVARKMGGGYFAPSSKVYVFSRTLPPGESSGYIFTQESPTSFMSQIRKQPGKDVWLMGGGELVRDFLRADLVDEIHLGIVPVLLGEGIPLFPPGFPQRDFALVENKAYDKGVVRLQYKRLHPKPKKN